MHVLVILKGIEKDRLKEYEFLYGQNDFKVMVWGKNEWDKACETLYNNVESYCIWKLVIIDAISEVKEDEYKISEDIESLLKEPDIKRGREDRRPPRHIYCLMRRKGGKADRCHRKLMEVIADAPDQLPPFARFFLMDYEDRSYLQNFENLKLICATIVLGKEEILEKLTEPYYIHQIQITIDEERLKNYLVHQEEVLLEQIDEMDKRKFRLECDKERGNYVIYDYLPEITAGGFVKIVLKHRFCVIKHKEDMQNWESDIANISADIGRFQREQRQKHRQLKAELNQRLGTLEGTKCYLDEQERQKIKSCMEEDKEKLISCYAEDWKLDKALSREKEKMEKKISYILRKRRTWKDVLQIVQGMYIFTIFSFLPFVGLYLTEVECLQYLQEEFRWNVEIPERGTAFFSIIICALCIPVVAVLYFLWFQWKRMWKAKKEYVGLLKKFNKGFKENYDRYKNFFSSVFRLRGFRKVLLGSKRYEKDEARIRSSLYENKEIAEKKLKNVKEFIKKFALLIEENMKDQNRGNFQVDRQIINKSSQIIKVNEEEMPVCEELPFVSSISLIKETHS